MALTYFRAIYSFNNLFLIGEIFVENVLVKQVYINRRLFIFAIFIMYNLLFLPHARIRFRHIKL